MTAARLTVALVLLLLVGVPLAGPLRVLSIWFDARMFVLGQNTFLLVLATLVLALPPGILLALLLERTDLPGRSVFRILLGMALFLPLPVQVSAWQVVLGAGGWVPVFALEAWTPWPEGLFAAAVLHALAGLPWVVLLVGLGLHAVEVDLEEAALIDRSRFWVIVHVTLRRCVPWMVASGLWLTMQTSGEIIISDLLQVRTYAEEIYTQLVGSSQEESLGRAVFAALLGMLAAATAGLILAGVFLQAPVVYRSRLILRLGPGRWLVAALVGLTVGILLAVPLASLIYRAGLGGDQVSWSRMVFSQRIELTARSDGWLLWRSLLLGMISGAVCAGLALLSCWLGREARWFRYLLLVSAAIAWAIPGPIVGLGLKETFLAILALSEGVTEGPARWLWYGPSMLPLFLVHLIRLFPYAVVIVWPAVQRVPKELFELTRVEGVTGWRELICLVLPLTWRSVLLAGVAVGILTLGELSAGKLVSTPEAESFAEVIWTQMHYGMTGDLAARCLLLIGLVLGGYLVVLGVVSAQQAFEES